MKKLKSAFFVNFVFLSATEQNTPGPNLGDRPGAGTGCWSWQLLQEVICGKLGESIVHDGLDETGDLFTDLRLDLIDDQLAVLVDELIDGVGQGRQLPVEQILEANICAADVEVDVGVEDAQLLRSGGSNGDD